MAYNYTTGAIRIIGGKWRGKKLTVIDQQGLRPTTDRLKETLFNWLMPIIVDSRCLDCFAGSGSLGFEALSRGAEFVTFLEQDNRVYQQLKQNSMGFPLPNSDLIKTDTLTWLTHATGIYDIVFIDPPFRKGLLKQTIHLLEHNGFLAEEAYIYIETEAELLIDEIPKNWQLHRQKQAGQVMARLFHRIKKW